MDKYRLIRLLEDGSPDSIREAIETIEKNSLWRVLWDGNTAIVRAPHVSSAMRAVKHLAGKNEMAVDMIDIFDDSLLVESPSRRDVLIIKWAEQDSEE